MKPAVMLTLAAMAPLFAALTWPPGGWSTALFFSTPILAAEATIVVLAVIDGFRLVEAVRCLQPLTRTAAFAWLLSASISMFAARTLPGVAAILFACTLLHALVGLAVWDRMRHGWWEWQDSWFLALALGMVGYLTVAAASVAAAWNEPRFPWMGFGAGVTNVRQIGFYGLVLVGLTCGLIGSGSRITQPRNLAALLLAGWFLVEWSGGRAALGAAICATAVVAAFAKGEWRRIAGLSLACALIAAPLSSAAAPASSWGAMTASDRVFSQPGNFSSGRADIWIEIWQKIKQAPVIGHGQGQFRHEVRASKHAFNHPHDALLQFLYDWGFLGTLLLATMLASSARPILQTYRDRVRPSLPAIGAAAGLVAMSSLEGSLYLPFPTFVATTSWAIILANAGHGLASRNREQAGAAAPQPIARAADL
jgi:O-antigen ligase